MRVRSGDVVVQGGASRGCYHGVARVLRGTAPARLREAASAGGGGGGGDDLRGVAEWLERGRININVRQVGLEAGWDEDPDAAAAVLAGGRRCRDDG